MVRADEGRGDGRRPDGRARLPVALGDSSGALRAQYAYDPFGGSTVTGDVRGADLGFTGRQDDGTGLMYYRDRYYSPSLGRFISEDPTGLAGGDNLYAYALDAPTVYTDPSGNNPLIVARAGGAAFGAAWSWGEQRLSGRKVDWGWSGVGSQALAGFLMGGAEAAIAARLAARLAESSNLWRIVLDDPGLSKRGLRPQPGTRVRPDGIPDNWRITGTDTSGGVRYYDPSNPDSSVRVMQGNPNSPYPNSQGPYVRWQKDGQPPDVNGNKLPSAKDPAAHIPLDIFQFLSGVFS